jgi:hypothetical protein
VALRTSLLHDPVALKRSEVRADAVVGKVKRLGQLLDGAAGAT